MFCIQVINHTIPYTHLVHTVEDLYNTSFLIAQVR